MLLKRETHQKVETFLLGLVIINKTEFLNVCGSFLSLLT